MTRALKFLRALGGWSLRKLAWLFVLLVVVVYGLWFIATYDMVSPAPLETMGGTPTEEGQWLVSQQGVELATIVPDSVRLKNPRDVLIKQEDSKQISGVLVGADGDSVWLFVSRTLVRVPQALGLVQPVPPESVEHRSGRVLLSILVPLGLLWCAGLALANRFKEGFRSGHHRLESYIAARRSKQLVHGFMVLIVCVGLVPQASFVAEEVFGLGLGLGSGVEGLGRLVAAHGPFVLLVVGVIWVVDRSLKHAVEWLEFEDFRERVKIFAEEASSTARADLEPQIALTLKHREILEHIAEAPLSLPVQLVAAGVVPRAKAGPKGDFRKVWKNYPQQVRRFEKMEERATIGERRFNDAAKVVRELVLLSFLRFDLGVLVVTDRAREALALPRLLFIPRIPVSWRVELARAESELQAGNSGESLRICGRLLEAALKLILKELHPGQQVMRACRVWLGSSEATLQDMALGNLKHVFDKSISTHKKYLKKAAREDIVVELSWDQPVADSLTGMLDACWAIRNRQSHAKEAALLYESTRHVGEVWDAHDLVTLTRIFLRSVQDKLRLEFTMASVDAELSVEEIGSDIAAE